MSDAVIDRLKTALGSKGWSDDPSEISPHLTEWRGLYRGRTPLLLKPETTAEVAAIAKICNETRTRLAIQGGNTGLVGGGVPDASGDEVLLSLARMKKIRALDGTNFTLTAEAGVTVAELQTAARDAGRFFPLSLASEGSCTLGGVVSTNAGGVNVLRYGTMRDLVLGLEVVLATGETWSGLSGLRKDNTGYDLKQWFIGAEGTLGIITAAVVKLFPAPQDRATAFVAVPSPAAATALLALMRERSGDSLTAFELMPRLGLELVLRHIPGTRDPLTAPAPWYVLLEATSSLAASGLDGLFEQAIGAALTEGLVSDGVVAQSTDQAAALWKLREALSEAQKLEGGSIKHDVSVPISEIPGFLNAATAAAEAFVPGARPVPFGHIGDGNIHFNVQSPPGMARAAFEEHWTAMNHVVHEIVVSHGGSISAEHGIGRLKRDELQHYKPPVALALMRQLKATLDPNTILNRGRIL